MESIFLTASLWLTLAVVSALIASSLRLSIALVEICVGVVAAAATGWFSLGDVFAANSEWVRFLAASGAIVLTFLAGAELDPDVIRTKLTEVSAVGLVGFIAPFLGCAAVAHYLLGWDASASWLCGIALSTTSTAVVYSVMYETGFNKTEYGKGILGSCFVNDLGSVLVLGLLFAPFTYKTIVFIVGSVTALALLPRTTAWLTRHYANRTAAIRTKWIMLTLLGLGGLALWSGSEAVVPAYLIGMVLAGSAAKDAHWIRRLRTLTVGFLTPFYFLRAGTLVSLHSLVALPLVFLALLLGKMVSKISGIYPVISAFRQERNERWYYTLLMSTGLTFGTISSLYGLSHGLVTQEQYSCLVAAIIASAVVPTVIAGLYFVPTHLLPTRNHAGKPAARINGLSEEG
jgi:Kef-type K+ transport system membrane component KefB